MLDRSVSDPDPATLAGSGVFSCRRSQVGLVARIVVDGTLDIATAAHVDEALRTAQADAAVVVVDLQALAFIDSSGARLLLEADLRARRVGGRLVVVRGPIAARLLEWAGIDRRLELVDRADPAAQPLPRCWQGRLS